MSLFFVVSEWCVHWLQSCLHCFESSGSREGMGHSLKMVVRICRVPELCLELCVAPAVLMHAVLLGAVLSYYMLQSRAGCHRGSKHCV